jgi:eukaryotic-like serine/threonine-protein kinase
MMASEIDRLHAALADRYRIEREIGRGGMATVYRAHDLKHDRPVAIKVLKPELAAALGAERFLREITLTARLDHPHILPLLDSGEAEGLVYYVMPYVEGESLRDRLNRERQLPLDDALQIVREVADALSHAHRLGIVHRDIKPENILLSAGHARVADFGIARAVEAAGGETLIRLTATGIVAGTPLYMSPEQANGERGVDARTDVYSLACVAYEMLAGQPPYTGATPQAILSRKSREAVPSLRVVREALPLSVEHAITKALAKVPADRFGTASQFIEALERARAAPAAVPRTTHRLPRRSWLLAAAAALVVLTTGWWGLTRPGPQSPTITSLAVLPFANLSGDPEQEYFVDGMHDAVIAELARLGTFKVIARTSVMRYRQTALSMPAIARELGVDALVEGTVLSADGRVRITAQLIEGRTDRHVWGPETYERDVRNVLALHAEVAGAVARQLAGSLNPDARQSLERAVVRNVSPAPDPAAYDAYLKGRYHMGQAGAGLALAVEHFERAIARDASFGLAHAALAQAHWWLWPRAPGSRERASVATRTAIELDPMLPEAHVALALERMSDWDWQGSEDAFRKALDLDPNSSVAHQFYAQLLRQTLRLDEAMRAARRAQDLDPFSLMVRTMVGWVLFNQRRYDEALDVWDSVLELEPEFGLALYNQGLAYWMKGMGQEVVASAERAKAARLPLQSDVPTDWLLAIGHALSGRHDQARAMLARLDVPLGLVAAVHHVLGEDDEALDCLERAVVLRVQGVPNITSEPIFDRLRDHPRFRALRAEMGLP